MLTPKPWRLEAVILLLAGIFSSLLAGGALASLLHHAHVAGFRAEDSLGMIMLGSLSLDGAVWVYGAVFLWWHDYPLRELFGFSTEKLKRIAGPVLLTAAITLPVALGLQAASAVVLKKLGWSSDAQEAVKLFANANSLPTVIYLVFFATVLAPVAEEFLFRGVLYTYLKQIGFPRLSFVGVSLLFAFIHLNAVAMVPLFFFALAQTWLYERTDCLIAPILTHSAFNTSNLVLMYLSGELASGGYL